MRMRRIIPLAVGMALSPATSSPARTLGEQRKAAWLSDNMERPARIRNVGVFPLGTIRHGGVTARIAG